MSIKTGNIIVLIVALLIIGIAAYTATQDGTYINEMVSGAKWWQYLLSVIGFIATVGLIIKYSKDSKEGAGFTLSKAISILVALAVAIGAFYL